ncbi:hypothetical protein QE152_g15937 [Popillia japonica]|uniref:Uncharacterized protein n=1 Tax=Popillia japonica TaxID=7064 RepID=A0AAW1L6T1_POPJA
MADGMDVGFVMQELNKVRKEQLIDIIVYQKLSSKTSNSVVSNYVSWMSDKLKDSTIHVTKTCSSAKHCLKNQLAVMEKMCYHLEKRTIEQEDLITMLKQYNYPCNATSETPTAGNVNNGVKSPQKKNPQKAPVIHAKPTFAAVRLEM